MQAELQTIRQTLKYPILKRQIIIKLATIVRERFWPSDSCSWQCDDDIHRLPLLFKYMDWATPQVVQDDGFRGRVPQKGCSADTEVFHTSGASFGPIVSVALGVGFGRPRYQAWRR